MPGNGGVPQSVRIACGKYSLSIYNYSTVSEQKIKRIGSENGGGVGATLKLMNELATFATKVSTHFCSPLPFSLLGVNILETELLLRTSTSIVLGRVDSSHNFVRD